MILQLTFLALAAPSRSTLSAPSGTTTVALYGCLEGGRSTATVNDDSMMNKSGMPTLDKGVEADITELDRLFGVRVPVYFIQSDVQNAFFTPDRFPDMMRLDGDDPDTPIEGSVCIYTGLLQSEWVNTAGSGLSIPAIIAHEFGHAMQHARNFPFGGKWRELDADFMAGWFTSHRGRFQVANNAYQAAMAFFTKGDGEFKSPRHHGTPGERLSAFNAGYTFNRVRNQPNAAEAYEYEVNALRAAGAE